jgi:hypothetical protein
MTQPGRVLRPVDPKRPLVLHTDWSVHGISAVLGQVDDEGHEYMCACISRSLNKHERNYPSYKGELLALAWAVRMFCHHLHGTSFKLVNDHQPLLWIMKARDLNGQYARWQLLLQEYEFEIVHRAGIKYTNADVLSRFPLSSSRDDSGAQFDSDIAGIARAIFTRSAPVSCPDIDSCAPRFKDLLRAGAPHIADHTYMDSAMRDPTLDELDPKSRRHVDELNQVVLAVVRELALAPSFPSKVQEALTDAKQLDEWYKPPQYGAGLRTHALDTSIIGPAFFPAVKQEGLVLIKLCAGIRTMLHALLRAGVRIRYHYYVDKDPIAKSVMREQLFNLSAKYPDAFPITAHAAAFDLPQHVSRVTREKLRDTLSWEQLPYLVTAGRVVLSPLSLFKLVLAHIGCGTTGLI